MHIPQAVTRWCTAIGVAAVLVACTTPAATQGAAAGAAVRSPSSIEMPPEPGIPATESAGTSSNPPGTATAAMTSASASSATMIAGGALRALAELPVKGRAPKTGYKRAQFGETWTDDVSVDGGHNGCDTRNDILRRDLTAMTLEPGSHGCSVATGTLHDPYSGRVISFVRGAGTSAHVQIDHVVALSDAWQKGAQALSAQERQNLAGDPLELLAVDGPTNESKGDGDAATWLPPVKSFRCPYVARQIAVKRKYALWVTAAERDAMAGVLADCPDQPLPTAAVTDTPPIRAG